MIINLILFYFEIKIKILIRKTKQLKAENY